MFTGSETKPSPVKNSAMNSKKATHRVAFLCCFTQSRQGWQKSILWLLHAANRTLALNFRQEALTQTN